MFYESVFRALNKARVKYLVAGGVAVVLYGYSRLTADLDLIIHLEPNNIDKFFSVLGRLGYRTKVPVTKEQFKNAKNRATWIKDKGMQVFSFYKQAEYLKNIDLFVYEPIRFNIMAKQAKKIRVKNITLPVLSINHLIKLKKKAGRQQDLIDIAHLEAIRKIKG